MSGMFTAKIQHVSKTEVNDTKAAHTETGDESHRQIVSDVTTTEQNDAYPAIMQERLKYLQEKTDKSRDVRGALLGALGFLICLGVVGSIVAIANAYSLGLASMLLVGTGIVGAGCSIEVAAWKGSQSSLKRMEAEEKQVFHDLADYQRTKSLAMARQLNRDEPSGRTVQNVTIQGAFSAEATPKAGSRGSDSTAADAPPLAPARGYGHKPDPSA
jgi:hypothetical protein